MKFKNENAFLSNMYLVRIDFMWADWKSVEHIFQAGKTLSETDREKIRKMDSPYAAKKYGRKVALRPDWDNIKVKLMLSAVERKFRQNLDLMDKLKRIDIPIVEHNTWHDNFWGDCICNGCAHVRGENCLGQILAKVRSWKY